MKDKELNEKLEAVVEGAQDKKAEDLISLDLEGLATFTDCFVICHGGSARHVQAISDAIVEAADKAGFKHFGMEGYNLGEWVLIDYVDVVVHVFHREKREFYDLEGLWGDAERRRHESEGTG